MGLRINNNIAALNSYNNVNRTDKAVSGSLEKLSSGFRINKAADDAAGLVVSEGLRSQIGGLTVASRNAQDGVNVAQAADGALGTATTILQRMRDLAVQASNSGSQDADAQKAANAEFAQLGKELDRIAQTTSFGSQKLLDGTYNGQFQIGAFNTANDRINVDLTSTVFGPVVTNVPATGGKSVSNFNLKADFTDKTGNSTPGADDRKTFTVNGTNVTLNTDLSSATDAQIKSAIDAALAAATPPVTGYTSSVTGAKLTLTNNTTGAGSAAPTIANLGTSTPTAGTDGTKGSATGFTAAGLRLDATVLTSAPAAQSAISDVDAALKSVTTARAAIGAQQNRFQYAINNLSVSIENITASESAIRDTDMAAEMTKFTKNQILSQAGTSMLAQANSSTQNILTLLRG